MEQKQKLSFSEWCENVWYHYKWMLICGVVFAIFLIVSCIQLFSNEDPDVNILHVGPMYISPTDAETLTETVATFAEDCTGDEEVNVSLLDITIVRVEDIESGEVAVVDERNKAYQRFQTEIRGGDAYIYVLDKEFFDECVELGILAKFDTFIDDADMPENVIDGYGVKISDLDSYKLPGLSRFSEDSIICLRRSPEEDEIKYGRKTEDWNNNKKTLINLIKYRHQEVAE